MQRQGLSSVPGSVEMKETISLGDLSGLNYGLLSGREEFCQAEANMFDVNDAEEAVKCLRRAFLVLNPGNHIAKRYPEHGSISFVHSRHATTVGKKYFYLRHVMEERARVDLLRDCLYRIKSLTSFIKDIQEVVSEEYQTLYSITHDCIKEIPVSKIYCLNALCEDLRAHIGHWNCIKQKLHTNRWLQPLLGALHFELDWVKRTLNQLCDKAIWWLKKFIMVGLQVFSHGNIDTVTHEMIGNLTRGLEDFNNIISIPNRHHMAQTKTSIIHHAKSPLESTSFDVHHTNSFANMGEHKPVSFTHLLNILANERCKYAALETHRFFTANQEFMKMIPAGNLPKFVWSGDSLWTFFNNPNSDTSDYHTADGSLTSLSAAVLQIGSLHAPDLSNLNSPLIELSRREHTFAENFLSVVCNSTNLLRRTETQNSRRAVRLNQPTSQSGKLQQGDTPVLSRADSLRKSVSWGDSADSSIRSQLTARYMDLYWNHFGTNLYSMFYEPSWIRHNSLYFSEMGSITLHSTTVVAAVKNMVQHMCLKDLFPSGSVDPMTSAVKRCLYLAAVAAWDKSMCESLGSQMIDKCYPCPLVNGNYCTRTAKSLKMTYQPLLYLLQEVVTDKVDPSSKGEVKPIGHIVMTAKRLLVTCDLALHWCQTKYKGFLASHSISNFILISSTDLKLLVEEIQQAMHLAQTISKSIIQKNSVDLNPQVTLFNNLMAYLNTVTDNLQNMPDTCMKEFSSTLTGRALEYLKSNMPQGKFWRRKSQQDYPKGHNQYIENALETVFEPVLEGVGNLKQSVQFGVISSAIEAFCQAWMSIILNEKIKFSYAGATLFMEDVKFMRAWLQRNIVNPEVYQSILHLSVLKAVGGAALLLLRQPSKQRSSSKFREPSKEDSVENIPASQLQGESFIHESEELISHVRNPDEWLALRVAGQGKNWRSLSSCLNPDS